jgi:phosphatidate cytidylyltransferase
MAEGQGGEGGEVVRFPGRRHPSAWEEEPAEDQPGYQDEPMLWEEESEEFDLDWSEAPATPTDVPTASPGKRPPPASFRDEPPVPPGADDRPRPWERAGPEPPEDEALAPAPDRPYDIESSPELEAYTHEDYVLATTQEYQGLAEAIAAAEQEEHEPQAVAASMPGLETGVVGFEDVIGAEGREIDDTPRARSDLAVRVGTGVALAALFVASLFAGGWWFFALVVALSAVALIELTRVLRSAGLVPLTLFALVGLLGAEVAAWLSGPAAVGGVVALVIVVVLLFYAVVPRRQALVNAGATVLAANWIGLLAFAFPIARAPESVALILAAVVVTVAFDTAQYFAGRSLGRRPLASAVSPNKTVEGYLGGVLVAIVVGVGLSLVDFFEPIGIGAGLALGLAVAVLGIVGDLSESLLKRALKVKDMGGILPGHGGVLDRIDAILFVVPAAYVIYLLAGYL